MEEGRMKFGSDRPSHRGSPFGSRRGRGGFGGRGGSKGRGGSRGRGGFRGRGGRGGGGGDHKKYQTNSYGQGGDGFQKPIKKSQLDKMEIEKLEQQLQSYDDDFDVSKFKTFDDFPISSTTKRGLKESGFIEPTKIQRESILYALRGKDILGAAKTGSGKTVAFLVPVLELLFRQQVTQFDGLGALIITPTRELAYQIFEVLKKIGKYHDFSGGLVIGGKDLHKEDDLLGTCNIVISTPGRLLYHMDTNPNLDVTNLKILVLDEADRILDMGFKKDMDAIFENLPSRQDQGRQTLLFSATQTKSVSHLARLSLQDPVYVSVHEHSKMPTPKQLAQSYVVCDLHQKINFLWSFLKQHPEKKILVFFASCKQVRFIYELFRALKLNYTMLQLHGTLHQLRRMSVYDDFCRKKSVVLFATDIASRGLDFPGVDWVVQMDCPENTEQYIHRAGRTARFKKAGQSLLVLLPSEESTMINELKKINVPLKKIQTNPQLIQPIQSKCRVALIKNSELKDMAQRAFKHYLRSIFLMKDKRIFDATKLDLESFAHSFGLVVTPRVRFIEKSVKRQQAAQRSNGDTKKKVPEKVSQIPESDSDESVIDENKPSPKAASELQGEKASFGLEFRDGINSDDDDDILIPGKKWDPKDNEQDLEDDTVGKKKSKAKPVTKLAQAKKLLRQKIMPNKKVIFDEEGNAKDTLEALRPIQPVTEKGKELHAKIMDNMKQGRGIDIELTRQFLEVESTQDKQFYRTLRKELKYKLKEKLRKEREERLGLKKQLSGEDTDEEPSGEAEVGAGTESEEDDEGSDQERDYHLQKLIDELPDPDKYYGKDDEDDGDEESIENEESSEQDEDSEGLIEDKQYSKNLSSKRKESSSHGTDKAIKEKRLKGASSSPPVSSGDMNLAEEEKLALQLLENS